MKDADVTMRFDTSEPNGPGLASLVFLEGDKRGQIVDVDKDRLTIGRLPDNDIVLASSPVSKRHAVVIRESSGHFIEDAGSTNGIYLNGTLIAKLQRKRLSQGDLIRITDHILLFRQSGFLRDNTGFSTIELDQALIESEAEDILSELGFDDLMKPTDDAEE